MKRNDVTDDLRAVMQAEDGRTIEELIEAEPFYDVVIEKADYDGKGTSVGFDDHMGTYLTGPEVKVGDTVTFYDGGTSPGFNERHGWALNGTLVEWLTPFERVAKRVAWLAEYDRDKRERFAKEREILDAKFDDLSEPLKARIDRFRSESPKFRVDSEGYEMVACVDADKIAAVLRPEVEAGESPEDVVKRFYDLSWEEQNAKVPGLDPGHSGNTFGGAISLARALLQGVPV